MTKQSQREWVTAQLIKFGKVSRNQALRRYISRLAARIADLRQAGFQITGERVKTKAGVDYVYRLEA